MTENATTTLVDEIRTVLREQLGEGVERVGQDELLAEALGDRYDSLAALEAVSAVESHFEIDVDFVSHDVRHTFATIGRIATFVRDELEDRERLRERR
ncbi:acyl carrier protein [Myceligenerans xiligouense]|uniref:Acyl carrier protein n=1 Tax=Myceligenerans xiligouense TaxID=253184 RepID=A0A3N4YN29_9MICO|nr:acyl carrier protein [Myceligenerans xiligouense]RPF20744.1 acyl carrier protein [Myceligenerans xiligouense]